MDAPYVAGNFAPVRHEHTLTDLPVTGSIPEHLDGRFLRNGPNPISEIDPDTYHWFMGDGMVHGVRIRDGKAEWYRNRWVRTPHVAEQLGERHGGGEHRAGFQNVGANTSVLGHAGRTLALIEGGVANHELTHELDTVGPCDFDGTLPGGYTAHPKRDPDTGELHAVSYFFGWGNTVRYSVIGTDGRARRTVDIEVTGSPMMHDFSLTEKHVVLYDLPVTFDARQATAATVPPGLRGPARLVLSALVGRVRVPDPVTAMIGRRLRPNSALPYRWNPRYPARVGVLPRDGDARDVRWFDVHPCYVFHPLNAYDDGDTVVLDVIRHPKMFDTDLRGPNEGTPTLDRWTVDLAARTVREDRLDDRGQEFPRLDERLVGRKHRYGYSITTGARLDPGGAVLKHDLTTGEVRHRSFGAGRQPTEFVFEPHRPDAAEDDGVLMGFVYDAPNDTSDLVLLDAGSLDTVASIHLPTRVPHGFHGNWVPEGR
ncbi:carotenoid oxygenase family protein [Haloechinothrix sp. YIM 98757]|uniref:Dioxygenase n=1 Tax=Haloechinothrix aidingensis TaxID=2752311 RepID=A0A838AF16_9PSEU|nr:carotenoid oxygenase family protein [Haloechinothrix aidingensis]MBA0127745.1 carotenoid oxygenase family protein [Haloechinothrix aidingensis]